VADASKTTHEAVHQLAFNSGVQKPGVMYPFWLSEGLACNFETADASKPFGPYMDNAGRRQRLLEAHGAGRLMGLESFVSLTRLPSDPGAVADLYSEGFGLFQFLFRKRHEQMRRYLVKLATGRWG
jgi:hypothetical protein